MKNHLGMALDINEQLSTTKIEVAGQLRDVVRDIQKDLNMFKLAGNQDACAYTELLLQDAKWEYNYYITENFPIVEKK